MAVEPKGPAFCPYCGSTALALRREVPHCLTCRAVFFLSFSRYARKAPRSRVQPLRADPI